MIVDLISDLFYTLGTKGVVVDDPDMEPDEGWGAGAVPRPEKPAVIGYLPVDDRLAVHKDFLVGAMADLARTYKFTYDLALRSIADEDWAESWKAFFHPEKITDHLVVKPTWREYAARPGEQVIEIDPGMAFGTGAHPSTTLCAGLLEKYLRPGDSVLDVGTGSGILLIAAAKLGAGHLTGVDVDPVAVNVARANLQRNGLEASQFELFTGHLVDPVSGRYQVVVANILADVVIELLDYVQRVLAPDGLFICSGIIESQRQAVFDKMEGCGYRLSSDLARGEWVALAGRRLAAGGR